jgi:tail tube protein
VGELRKGLDMSSAKSSQGVTIKRATVAIGEVSDISGPDESVDRIEVTHLASTSKEYIAGLRDGGEVKCEANTVASNTAQQALYTDFQSGASAAYSIDCGSGEHYDFSAIVTGFSRKFSANAKRSLSFTLKITGDVTATYA